MPTLPALTARIAKLERQAAALLNKERRAVIAKVTAYIEKYGLLPAELGFRAGKGSKAGARKSKTEATRSVGVPKYRDPDTGKTWTGRGKPPAWIAAAIKQGRKDDFLIDRTPASGAAAPPPVPRTTRKGAAAQRAASGKKVTAKGAPKQRVSRGKPAGRRPAANAKKATRRSPARSTTGEAATAS